MRVPRKVRRFLVALIAGGLAALEFVVFTVKLDWYYSLPIGAALALGAGLLVYQEGPRTSPITCENVLRVMVVSLFKERALRYRANVMVTEKKGRVLRIRSSYNLDGHLDRHIRIPVGSGCAGHSFRSGNIETFDFSVMNHAALGIDPKKTPVWAELRSIISYPIKQEDGKVVGVLSIDSSEPMDATGFRDPALHIAIGLYAELALPFVDTE